MIPYGRQQIDESDIEAVVSVLRSDFLTTGPTVERFERAFADFVGAEHAVAVCNGTAALHLAMLAAGVREGDRVVTSPNTFLASANGAAYVGATPDFCDIDPDTFTLCPQALEAEWRPDTSAVVAVDYAGQAADMPAIAEVARRHDAVIVEDACHAVGGKFQHGDQVYSVGGHPWADITTYSFHPVKTMTTAEGGMLVTDNEEYAATARLLRNHGMTREPSEFVGLGSPRFEEQGPWYYEMQQLGWNYRLTDLQCALGLSQLRRLPSFIQRRQEIVALYNEQLAGVPFVTPPKLRNPSDAELTSWHLYAVQIDFEQLGMTRTHVMHRLREQGVGTQVHYIPVHLQPWYRTTFGYEAGKCPIAERLSLSSLSLPLYPDLTDADVLRVVSALRSLAPDLG